MHQTVDKFIDEIIEECVHYSEYECSGYIDTEELRILIEADRQAERDATAEAIADRTLEWWCENTDFDDPEQLRTVIMEKT
jgi:uncharacterized protein YggL (DUF469 family)